MPPEDMVVTTTCPPRWRASTSSAWRAAIGIGSLLVEGDGGPAGRLGVEVGAGKVGGRVAVVEPGGRQPPGGDDRLGEARAVVPGCALLIILPAAHADEDEQRQAE